MRPFEQTFQSFDISHDVQDVVAFIDKVLEEYGGRFFEGYTSAVRAERTAKFKVEAKSNERMLIRRLSDGPCLAFGKQH